MKALERFLPDVLAGNSLSREDARSVMYQLSRGDFDPQTAARFLLGLKEKGESSDEIAGFVDSLRAFTKPIDELADRGLIDVCGTGGGSASTFNVSTSVSFVVASAGVPVAKHGNRSVSSKCGSFDVLEALGLSFSDENDRILQSIERFNLGFLFAPYFHPALKSVAELRKKLGVKTVFNLLGPLLNPMKVKRQVVGVYELGLLEKIPLVLRDLGAEESIVVYGEDGVDEFSISGSSSVAHLKQGMIQKYRVSPEDFGLKCAEISDVEGGSPLENAKCIVDVLDGKPGAPRDLVVLNCAFAFLVAGRVGNPIEGVRLAEECLSSGKARRLLEKMREFK